MLYIIATPIGNLEDISQRALRILKAVDLILCEDTRRTRKLLSHFKIKNRLLSYHQHSKLKKKNQILNLLREGKTIALVCNAGTPGISDPGNELIEFLLKRIPDLEVVPIPGPSAITAVASISGFSMNKFLFLGFPPKKRGRKQFFKEIVEAKYPVIFFEAPYRILRTLDELREVIGDREIMIGRELTKKFETIYRGDLENVLKQLKIEKEEAPRLKGEFVIIANRK